MAEMFPNVFFDVGVILHYTGAMSSQVLGEALEIVALHQAALQLRRLRHRRVRTIWARCSSAAPCASTSTAGSPTAPATREAERIAGLIAVDNARRIYPLQLTATEALLAEDDPPPYELFNPEGAAPILLICDHASRFVPRQLRRARPLRPTI